MFKPHRMIGQRPVPRQNESFANTSRKPLKNGNQTPPSVRHPTRKPAPAPNTPPATTAQMPDPHKCENPGRYGRAATGHQITISRRSVPTKTRTFLPQPKEMPETRLRINTINAIFKP